jgi:hypothetical protein
LASLESAGDAPLLWTDAPASMQATRQSRAKVKRNVPPRSGLRSREDQPQQPVYRIQTRTTNREDRNRQRCGEEAEGQAMTQVGFVRFAVTSWGISRRERSSGRANHVLRRRPIARTASQQKVTRNQTHCQRYVGQYGDIASPLRGRRDLGLRLTFLLERSRAERLSEEESTGSYERVRC